MRHGGVASPRSPCSSLTPGAALLQQRHVRVEPAAGVALGHFEQRHLVAAAGGAQLHLAPAAFGEEPLPDRHVEVALGEQHQRRDLRRHAVVLRQERFEQLRGGRTFGTLEHAGVAAHHPAAPHLEQLHHGEITRLRHAQEVELAAVHGDHRRLVAGQAPERLQPVAVQAGQLEVLPRRRRAHLAVEHARGGLHASLQEGPDLRHHRRVRLGCGVAHARP
jgi:hypothetical protein